MGSGSVRLKMTEQILHCSEQGRTV